MSLVTKILAGFPVVALVSTFPFTLVANKDKELKVEKINEILKVSPADTQGKVSQSIEKLIEEGNYEGCAELGRSNGKSALWFVCSKKENSNKPSFFNYDRTRSAESRVIQVISVISTPKREIKFVTGKTENLRFLPPWMHKLKGRNVIPERNCNFTKEENTRNKKSYTLSCLGEEIQREIQFENETKKQ